MRTELRLSGSGGQGLIMAGILLAEASGVFEAKNVVQTQSYGPEARGGASRSEVVISDHSIRYPRAYDPDILLCLSQASFDRFAPEMKADGLIFADDFYVRQHLNVGIKCKNLIMMPFLETARDVIGREVVTNVVALGALAASVKIVKLESLKKAVESRMRRAFHEINGRALDAGFKLGEDAWKKHSS